MAKDARGHGSNSRGGRQTPVQSENAPFVSRLGAAAGHSYLDPRDPRGGDQAAAAKLREGAGPKADAVPVHPAQDDGHAHFRQVAANNAAFMAKYGGPRDHAREQRAFNSGKREISRLKRQGK